MRPTSAQNQFARVVKRTDAEIMVAEASLYLAQAFYPDLQINTYLTKLDAMAAQIRADLPAERYPLRLVQHINRHLFQELKFQGNTDNYYDPRNSFLNEVLERRIGIPISLSLVYLEVAQRLNFPMVGIGMPGHFLIRPNLDQDMDIYVDPFHQGEVLFQADCAARLKQIYGESAQFSPDLLQPVSNRQFLGRMLTNLKLIYLNRQEFSQALAIVDHLVILFPEAITERRDRGLLCYQLAQSQAALADLTAYLDAEPLAKDATTIRQIILEIQMDLG